MSDISKQVEEIREALNDPPEALRFPHELSTGASKMAKAKKTPRKVLTKKVATKAAKKTNGAGSGRVTVADLAEEAKVSPQRARQKLREADMNREGRWNWEAGSKELQAARKALGLS